MPIDPRMTALERAFQLARSGHVSSVGEIISALKRDGYSDWRIEGPLLRRQLAGLIKVALKGKRDAPQTMPDAGASTAASR